MSATKFDAEANEWFAYKAGKPNGPQPLKGLNIATLNCDLAKNPMVLARAIESDRWLRLCHIIMMQEMEAHAGENFIRPEVIANETAYNCIYAPARGETHKGEPGTHGLAIYSRIPLGNVEVLELPRFDLKKKTRRRIALKASVLVGTDKITLLNTHLDTQMPVQKRIEQITPAIRAWAKGQDRKVVLAGDVNTIGLSYPILGESLLGHYQRKQFEANMAKNDFVFPKFSCSDYTMDDWYIFRQLPDGIYAKNMTIDDWRIGYHWKQGDHKYISSILTW